MSTHSASGVDGYFLQLIRLCSDLQLAELQHDLAQFPEDEAFRLEVLKEISRRGKSVCSRACDGVKEEVK